MSVVTVFPDDNKQGDKDKAMAIVNMDTGEIMSIKVFSEEGCNYRRQGVGRRLVQKIEGMLRGRGHRVVYLMSTTHAMPFWYKLGYDCGTTETRGLCMKNMFCKPEDRGDPPEFVDGKVVIRFNIPPAFTISK